jgi:shikimate dehydrogenase
MPKLAVLGQPVSHSRSPAMQNAALAELNLAGEWSYDAIEVSPEGFEALVRELPGRGFAGVNVTVPHKLAALAVASAASEAAREIGAANTLTFAEGEISAENTDAVGILDAIAKPVAGNRALVLGAGGSARAAIWALHNAGAKVEIWNRTAAKAAALAEEFAIAQVTTSFGQVEIGPYDLVINATTVGLEQAATHAATHADLKAHPVDADSINARTTVVDLVYGTHETALIAHARANGATVVDGLEVLVRQGAASLRIWTGIEPPLETMRRAAGSNRPDGNREPRRTSHGGPGWGRSTRGNA